MKIALGQINPTVGDFSGNATKIIQFALRARSAGAGLILFPELSVSGYPPRDLVERPSFVARNRVTVERIAVETQGIAVICGMVTAAEADSGKKVMNSAALLRDGRIVFIQSKMLLPTYDVFDEMRNFAPAKSQKLFNLCGQQMALTICEDAWNDKRFWNRRLYGVDPVEELVRGGGNFVLNISASPFWLGKRELRRDMLAAIARNQKVPVAMVNQVGGNDSLVFDGSSLVVAPDGRVIAQAKSFEEDLIYFDSQALTGDMHPQVAGEEASAYEALVLGTRDYVHKCGFQRAILGLSGGIDSALTASIAVDALGSENVIGVGMPGPYSSRGSIDDARALAINLKIRFELLSIQEIYEAALRTLAPIFAGMPADVTEENVQSRARGLLLMSMSNKLGALVLSTGNKSELAVGYCTLYGDMCG
ncbi:MAG: NAD+ synthase, partial [Terriglobales bacterium]